jgi:Xaa-Pro dipeptidase
MDSARLRNLMDSEGVSAIIATSLENVYYSTGNYNLVLQVIPDRPLFAIFFRDSEPAYLVNIIEEDFAKDESWIRDIRVWQAGRSPVATLVDTLKERGVLEGKVALELLAFPTVFYQELVSIAPKTVFVDASRIFGKLREIKESKEIELLEFAAVSLRKSMEGGLALTKPDWSEKKISEVIGQEMISLGFDEIAWRTAGTGTNTLNIHRLPTDRKIATGETLKSDCGGKVQGYYADLARMAVVGKPSEKQKAIYKAIVRAEKETIENLKVGMKISDVYKICKKTFEENYDATFRFPLFGHGIGVILHDEPQMVADNEQCLEENMVINIEPVHIDPGVAVYHVEDTVLVTSSGPKVLTGKLPDEELYKIT